MDNHSQYMQKAIELAEQARGKCSPNPFVGAVIVKDSIIIGEGFTQEYGSDHAEVQAIKNATADCSGASMYVTLEPCSHFGKTPPCAKAIIDSGINSVIVGIKDPNPLVSGKGIQMLEDAGIKAETGLLADVITKQLEYYLTFITKKRPYVVLKTATTLGGRIAAEDGSSRWISCEDSRKRTHELREEADAIITGIGTVLNDNPMLNVRLDNPYKQPLRVILDTKCRLPLDCNIALTSDKQKTILFSAAEYVKPEKEKNLAALGVEIVKTETSGTHLNIDMILNELYNRNISAILLEAGSNLNSAFLNARLVDKIIMFIAPKLLGGNNMAWHNIGIDNIEKAIYLTDMGIEKSGSDFVLTGYPVYN